MKETLADALPVEVPEMTLMASETAPAAPCESVTVKVRVWMPGVEGAVQDVLVAAGVEKLPAVAVHAEVSVSPVLGSRTVALRETVPPVCTVVMEATTESMRGASLP